MKYQAIAKIALSLSRGKKKKETFVEAMEAVRHVTPFRKKPEKMWVLAYQAHFYVCTDCARSGALQKPALGMHIMGITGNDVEKKNHTQTHNRGRK